MKKQANPADGSFGVIIFAFVFLAVILIYLLYVVGTQFNEQYAVATEIVADLESLAGTATTDAQAILQLATEQAEAINSLELAFAPRPTLDASTLATEQFNAINDLESAFGSTHPNAIQVLATEQAAAFDALESAFAQATQESVDVAALVQERDTLARQVEELNALNQSMGALATEQAINQNDLQAIQATATQQSVDVLALIQERDQLALQVQELTALNQQNAAMLATQQAEAFLTLTNNVVPTHSDGSVDVEQLQQERDDLALQVFELSAINQQNAGIVATQQANEVTLASEVVALQTQLQSSELLAQQRVKPVPSGISLAAERDYWRLLMSAPNGQTSDGRDGYGIDHEIAELFLQAQSTIDIAVPEFTNKYLLNALLEAQARNVRVRIVTDDRVGNRPELTPLLEAGISIINDGNPSVLMNHKFAVIDNQAVLMGTMSYTKSAVYRNNNSLLLIQEPVVVSAYTQEFSEMFDQLVFGNTNPPQAQAILDVEVAPSVEVIFSPDEDLQARLLELIGTAQTSITFMNYHFTDEALARALQDKAQAGVTVRGMLERTQINRHSQYDELLCAGVEMVLDGNRYGLAHKVLVVDAQTVVMGSSNFTTDNLTEDDNSVVVITDPALAQLFIEEYERLIPLSNADDVPSVTCE
ncbi:MAG: phospholipase D-like domain-containing protein [Phototrophicaceae bacterium]